MSWFSFLRKNKQESASDDSAFTRAKEGPSATRNRGGKRKKGNQEEPIDPVLPQKKRARRRLIGVIALVLAAVIGLPMILDSEPKPLADDIAIQIPSKDKPAQPSAPSPAPTVSAAAALDPKEEVVEAVPSTAAPANEKAVPNSPAPPVAGKNESIKPVEPPKAAVAAKPTIAPPTAQTPPKTESKESKAAEKNDDARAIALLEGRIASKTATEKKSEKFVIQVAALATKEKVNELQAKLKNAGIKSFTQKVSTDSGERIRVRVGPFDSREEADKMRAKIGKLGMNGTVVPA